MSPEYKIIKVIVNGKNINDLTSLEETLKMLSTIKNSDANAIIFPALYKGYFGVAVIKFTTPKETTFKFQIIDNLDSVYSWFSMSYDILGDGQEKIKHSYAIVSLDHNQELLDLKVVKATPDIRRYVLCQ